MHYITSFSFNNTTSFLRDDRVVYQQELGLILDKNVCLIYGMY